MAEFVEEHDAAHDDDERYDVPPKPSEEIAELLKQRHRRLLRGAAFRAGRQAIVVTISLPCRTRPLRPRGRSPVLSPYGESRAPRRYWPAMGIPRARRISSTVRLDDARDRAEGDASVQERGDGDFVGGVERGRRPLPFARASIASFSAGKRSRSGASKVIGRARPGPARRRPRRCARDKRGNARSACACPGRRAPRSSSRPERNQAMRR